MLYLLILGDPGAVSGGGKKSKRAKKSQQRSLLVLDFSSPEIYPRPFRLFPAPTNCPWVSEDVICSKQLKHRKLKKLRKKIRLKSSQRDKRTLWFSSYSPAFYAQNKI